MVEKVGGIIGIKNLDERSIEIYIRVDSLQSDISYLWFHVRGMKTLIEDVIVEI